MSKTKFQTLQSSQLEETNGGYYERWYGYRRAWGPERFYAREERFGHGSYAYARFERRYGW